eukprot:CAMPEP_0197446520 /NCGR_PEP_ID=MMETSP1175-20131217/11453_1 /TAXON_ID=1003142 /ORGANISM="Triceratium dubium, Strain CCMP147" /LENGTH=283 /DNA_ID=CAMNT_0042977653 /DNA_START=85 /DNA_END=936 /DNA_ORIENTATION=+
MKPTTFLLFFSIWAANASLRPPTPFISRNGDTTQLTRSLSVRGGDLGPISAGELAKTFGVLAIGDAVSGAVAPVEVWEKIGVNIEKGSKGEHYLGHGMAASALSLSVMSLLALFEKCSTQEAIAYGFLTRGAFMTEMLLNGKYKELGVPSAPHLAIYLAILATSFALLSGKFEPMNAAKIISVLLSGHGALLFLNPRTNDDDKTKKMAKIDGGYMFISSVFAAFLAFGVDPVRAMGFTSIACLPLMLSVFDLISADEIFGLSPSTWLVALFVFIGASAYGMLS